MEAGKVLALYMTMPDLMRSGHRMMCDDFDCDPNGIIGDKNYEEEAGKLILLVSQKSYEIIEQAEIVLDTGILMENIFVDVDINHLKSGTIIEIGETLFEVVRPCEAFNYLYGFAPELPELLQGNRGIFISAIETGRVEVGNTIQVIQEPKE